MKKNYIVVLALLFICSTSHSMTESKTSTNPNDQATFNQQDNFTRSTGGRGCEFRDNRHLWISSRSSMRGDVIIQNKLNVAIKLENINNQQGYKILNPGEEKRFAFDSGDNRITAYQQNPTTGKWSISPSTQSPLSSWIWVKFCKVNYASFGPAGPKGSNDLKTK